MIVTATRITRSSGARNLAAHLLDKHDENEKIELIFGSREDLDTFTRAGNTKYSMRHIAINPGTVLTDAQMWHVINLWRQEFNAFDRPIVIVAHEKKLADGTPARHYHVVMPEQWDRVQLDYKFWKIRQEKVSRIAEYELNLPLTCGRHNAAVANALEREERHDIADAVRVLTERPRPREAFTSTDLQRAKRNNINLPRARATVARAFENAHEPHELITLLAKEGYRIKQGDKAVIVVDENDNFIGALHRLVRAKKKTINDFMSAKGGKHGREADTSLATPNNKQHKEKHGRNTVASDARREQRKQPDFANTRNTSTNRYSAAATANITRKHLKHSRIIATAKINAAIRAHKYLQFALRCARVDAFDFTETLRAHQATASAAAATTNTDAQQREKTAIEAQLEQEGWRVPTVRH